MARPSKRWSVVLSLCLLLQQFSLTFTIPLEENGIAKSNWSNVEDDAEHQDEEQVGVKKSALQLLKFIGGNAIKAITISSTALTLTATIIQAIEGCGVSYPSITKDFDEFQRLKKEYDDTNDKIRDESRQAKNRQLYANDTFYNYRETRDQLRRINDEAALVLKSMGPEVLITLNTVSQDIERIMEKANQTNSQVDLLEVDTTFAEGLDLALRITFPALVLAVPGIKRIWKSHLKKTYMGKKILEFRDRFKTSFVTPKTEKARKTFSKIMSRGFLGKVKGFITTKLNKLVTRFAPKFEKIKNVFGKIATGIKGLMKLGGAALAVWTAYETFNDCKKKADEAKESVSNMRKHVQDIKKYLEDVKQGNEEVNEAWIDVRNTTMATELINTLQAIKEMILDDYMSKAQEEKQDISQKIQKYIDAADLDVSDEQSKIELNERQLQMNEILGIITVTLGCHKNKGNTFNAVKSDCALGDSAFREAYRNALSYIRVDPAEQCQLRTGEDYISEQKMKSAWEDWVNRNKTVSALCLMNNPATINRIKDLLRKQVTDPRQITDEIMNPKKREYSYDEIAEIVKKILADNPDISKELPETLKGYVCMLLDAGIDAAEIVTQLSIIAKSIINRDLTVEEINKVDCE